MSEENNEKKMLTQEEIDALMNNTANINDQGLSEEEIDVLGEIGNIAMGSSATALNAILDQKVEITTPQVRVTSFGEITEEYSRPCVLVQVEYKSGLEGTNVLIIKSEDALLIADLMMGGNGIDIDGELDEIKLSAIGEAMNQMIGSAATSMSSIINEVVNITPPEVKYLDINDAYESGSYFKADEMIVDTSFQLKIGDLLDSSFKQLAPLEFAREMVRKISSDGLTVKEEIPESEIDDTELLESTVTVSAPEKETVGVKRAQFPDFGDSKKVTVPQNMELIQDVPLQITVQLGKARMTIKEILELGEGSIVELDKLAGEAVDLLVNGKLIAKGEVVVIDENFGFRVKDIVTPMERLNNL
ncbi:MAG: flagellar motor switch phosphatase FliY [Halanaerobiaceae bacterium]|jgi:flagellar motor switch protein FliN/FliY|nr:flagellar motor switch phosphatase FliY [Halanaerobiaceae bacterium]